jgi:5S rRNA maturation endonuclease (ribonuclease M5)
LMNGWFTQSCYRRKPFGYAFIGPSRLLGQARLERLEDNGDYREMSRAVQRRATSSFSSSRRAQRLSEFVRFLVEFIDELNVLALDGAAVLVEGQRDRRALINLGYEGPVLTRASLSGPRIERSLSGVRSVVVLMDMDREGRKLTARYISLLQSMKVATSLSQRLRLKRASGGVFLHIENLSRFAPEVPEIRSMTGKMRV